MDYSGLSNYDLWALAVGFLSPLVLSVIQQSKWSTRTQSIVAFAFCFAVALVATLFQGTFDLGDLARTFLLVFLASSVAYKSFWKPTGVSPAIEAATSPKSLPEPPRA